MGRPVQRPSSLRDSRSINRCRRGSMICPPCLTLCERPVDCARVSQGRVSVRNPIEHGYAVRGWLLFTVPKELVQKNATSLERLTKPATALILHSSSQAMAHPARQRRRRHGIPAISSNNFDLTPAALCIDLCRSAAPSQLFLRSGSTAPSRDSPTS